MERTIESELHILLDDHYRASRKIWDSIGDDNAIAKEHQLTDDYADKIIALFWKKGLLLPQKIKPVEDEE
jgi:hypothetical protein